MKRLLLLGALAIFAFTASAQSDAPATSDKEKTEKVCAKTGKTCSTTCANKKTDTCCEGKQDGENKASSSKDADNKSCSKDGEKKACCSKDGDKKAGSKDVDKKSFTKISDASPAKSDNKTKSKTVGLSN